MFISFARPWRPLEAGEWLSATQTVVLLQGGATLTRLMMYAPDIHYQTAAHHQELLFQHSTLSTHNSRSDGMAQSIERSRSTWEVIGSIRSLIKAV